MATTTTTTTTTAKRQVKVDIISDGICPFCIIGLRNLQSAISSPLSSPLPLEFEIEFKPFLLDPTLTDKPVDKTKRYQDKFGKERFEVMEKQMIARGEKVGVKFDYRGTLSQTTTYHRLLTKAYQLGSTSLQLPLVERLFLGYFSSRRDPSDLTWLSQESVSLKIFPDEEAAMTFLRSDECLKEVEQGYRNAKECGVSGVPFFVFDGKWAMSGAQPVEAFQEVFKQLAMAGQEENGRDAQGKDAREEGLTC